MIVANLLGVFLLNNCAMFVHASHLFKAESTVVSLVFERVIALSTTAPAPAQSAVCTDTTNLGKERDHVALQSGIGQVLLTNKNIRRNFSAIFF